MSQGSYHIPRIVVAGTNSGVGKTTLTIGLLAALFNRGLVVQSYKAGPDYIDPAYHTAVTGVVSRNLDSWMLGSEVLREVFFRHSQNADMSVIEGVMGLNDGKGPLSDEGSTAEISRILHAPVILVLDAAKLSRSAAAIVLGFQQFNSRLNIAGVIVNFVGGEGHYQVVKTAVESECQIPVLGYLPNLPEVSMPERHLGLIPAIERGELKPLFQTLAHTVQKTIDINRLIEIAAAAPNLEEPIKKVFATPELTEKVTIAVAFDAAFNFYYPENLELLELHGAKLAYFSPLAGEDIPANAAGLYLGGGFPEEFAERLATQRGLLDRYRDRIRQGIPTFAECGGLMFLSEEIRDRNGTSHAMLGLIPTKVAMQEQLTAFGYREVTAVSDNLLMRKDEHARGHEFHYSVLSCSNHEAPYEVSAWGTTKREGFMTENILAGYTHLHFGSNPRMAKRFVAACAKFQSQGRHNSCESL